MQIVKYILRVAVSLVSRILAQQNYAFKERTSLTTYWQSSKSCCVIVRLPGCNYLLESEDEKSQCTVWLCMASATDISKPSIEEPEVGLATATSKPSIVES